MGEDIFGERTEMIADIVKEMDKDRLINEGGTYICSECPHYDPHALENCALGFVAPSDCPRVVEAAVDAARLLEAEEMREIPKGRPGDVIPEVSIAGYFVLGVLAALFFVLLKGLIG